MKWGKPPACPCREGSVAAGLGGPADGASQFLAPRPRFFGPAKRLSTVSPSVLSTECGFFFSAPRLRFGCPRIKLSTGFSTAAVENFYRFLASKIPKLIIAYLEAFAQYANFAGRGTIGASLQKYAAKENPPERASSTGGFPFAAITLRVIEVGKPTSFLERFWAAEAQRYHFSRYSSSFTLAARASMSSVGS